MIKITKFLLKLKICLKTFEVDYNIEDVVIKLSSSLCIFYNALNTLVFVEVTE